MLLMNFLLRAVPHALLFILPICSAASAKESVQAGGSVRGAAKRKLVDDSTIIFLESDTAPMTGLFEIEFSEDNPNNWMYTENYAPVTGFDPYEASTFKKHRSASDGFIYKIYGVAFPNSMVALRLGFAEIYTPNCADGKRIMSIDVNGAPFVTNMDVYKEAGCNTAYIVTKNVVADSAGNLAIAFSASVENVMVSFLEVRSSASTPTVGPVAAPVDVPVAAPVIAPVAAPVDAPVAAPVDAPVAAPTDAPVAAPVAAPTVAPVAAPVPSPPIEGCKVPRFVGDWVSNNDYPINLAESQGATILDDLVVVSGFAGGFSQSTEKVHAFRYGDPNADWREMDDFPIERGVTHAAFTVVGPKLYLCGGFQGGHPGPHIPDCYVYDHSIAPGDGQWTAFSFLPEGRAGGGMVYDINSNSLIFSAGAERPQASEYQDYPHTWTLSLSDINGPWVARTDIPYLTNHMSYATGIDGNGNQRHFFLGGQIGEDEHGGNHEEVYEYSEPTDTWIERTSMPFARGHASSSTKPIGCGFIVAGGSTNNGLTRDISYYDIPSDAWQSIGELRGGINTPVCDFGTDGYFYCESGYISGAFSYKIKFELV